MKNPSQKSMEYTMERVLGDAWTHDYQMTPTEVLVKGIGVAVTTGA